MKSRRGRFTWAVLGVLLLLNSAAVFAAPFRLVSTIHSSQAPVSGGNGDSFGAAVSADGRFVLFGSSANNLVLNSASNPIPVLVPAPLNVFLRDRSNATTTLVSVNLSGLGGGNADSVPSAISTNGRYALFESSASDLVAGDTNKATDIFVRDLVSGTTTLVSASTNGEFANKESRSAVMTPDGRYIAFVSAANNLVADDTNNIADVFERDLQTSNTVLVSVGAISTNSLFSSSELPDITPDGRYVAFFSTATNLVPGVATVKDVYVRDLVAGSTTWASTNARSIVVPFFGGPNIACFNHALSADGRYVAFECSTNLPTAARQGLILRHSLETGTTTIVETNANLIVPARPEELRSLAITPEGRFIVYVANTNGTDGITTCIRRWDGNTGTGVLVSGNLSNQVPAGSKCHSPSIDLSGQFVVFVCNATNMVTNTVVGDYHVYVRDVQAGATRLVDVDSNGMGVSISPATVPLLNWDGGMVVFDAMDSGLVANDRNHDVDVFARVLASNSCELISAHHSALGSITPNGMSGFLAGSISADGRYVAFYSEADNLVTNDLNECRDIFVRDRVDQSNLLISVGTNGLAGNGPSTGPVSGVAGRYIAFSSYANNLVPGDTNNTQDVFVRDLQTGTTVLVSVNTTGFGPGNAASYSPVISQDGRSILFLSLASNLAAGSFTGGENLFLRQLDTGMTYALTFLGTYAADMTSDGRFVAFQEATKFYVWDSISTARVYTNNTSSAAYRIAITSDGAKIAYLDGLVLRAADRVSNSNWVVASSLFAAPRTGLRFTADGKFLVFAGGNALPIRQVWLHDMISHTNILISRSIDGTNSANGHCDSPEISPDGRFIVFRSWASNLVTAADAQNSSDVFLHDRANGTTTLLSASRYSNSAADNISFLPGFSPDGRSLFFQSAGSDIAGSDFNHGIDIVGLGLLYANIVDDSPTFGPTISWWTRPGETYAVEFKSNLEDSSWQTVVGTITVNGERAQITDQAPSEAQRFYRLTAH